MKNKTIIVGIVILSMFFLSSCAPGDGTYTLENPAGFFWGIWHGWIAPFTLIVGFFKENIRVYEPNNTGWFYDLGFYMAIISGFGGLKLGRSKKEK